MQPLDPCTIDPQVMHAISRCRTDVDYLLFRTKQAFQVVREPENSRITDCMNILPSGFQDHDARHTVQQVPQPVEGGRWVVPGGQWMNVMKLRGSMQAADIVQSDCAVYTQLFKVIASFQCQFCSPVSCPVVTPWPEIFCCVRNRITRKPVRAGPAFRGVRAISVEFHVQFTNRQFHHTMKLPQLRMLLDKCHLQNCSVCVFWFSVHLF